MKKILKLIYYKLISAKKVAKLSGVTIGENCRILTKQFGSEPYLIHIGNNFNCASNVQFITHDGTVNVIRVRFPEYKDIDMVAPIVIGNNVTIGYGTILLPGTVIEDNVIIGAGAVVRGRVKSDGIYAGVPVKFICSLEDYVARSKHNFMYTRHLAPEEKHKVINELIAERHPEFHNLKR